MGQYKNKTTSVQNSHHKDTKLWAQETEQLDRDPGENSTATAKWEDIKWFVTILSVISVLGKAGISHASQIVLTFSKLCAEKKAHDGRDEHWRRLEEEQSEAWHSTAKQGARAFKRGMSVVYMDHSVNKT